MIPRLVAVAPKPGQWHEFQVEVRGDRLRASLDGIRVLEGRDSTLAAGYLGLQHHAGMKIEFRRIVIRDLGRPFSESGKASRPPGL